MPTRRAVFYWVDERPEFASRYAMARQRQGDWHYDRIVRASEEAKDLTSNVAVQAIRVHIDGLKWAAARLRPEVYAEHTSKTIVIEPGAGYAALLEEIDNRQHRQREARTIDGEVVQLGEGGENTDSAALPRARDATEGSFSGANGSASAASDGTDRERRDD